LNPFDSNPATPAILPAVSAQGPLFAVRDPAPVTAPLRPLAIAPAIADYVRRKYPTHFESSPRQVEEAGQSKWKSLSPIKNFVTAKRNGSQDFGADMLALAREKDSSAHPHHRKSSMRKLSGFLKQTFLVSLPFRFYLTPH
jgi:hypothetical protein